MHCKAARQRLKPGCVRRCFVCLQQVKSNIPLVSDCRAHCHSLHSCSPEESNSVYILHTDTTPDRWLEVEKHQFYWILTFLHSQTKCTHSPGEGWAWKINEHSSKCHNMWWDVEVILSSQFQDKLLTRWFFSSPQNGEKTTCWHLGWNVGSLWVGGPSVPLCDLAGPPLITTGSWISCPSGSSPSNPPNRTYLWWLDPSTLWILWVLLAYAELGWTDSKSTILCGQPVCVAECDKNNVPTCHRRLATQALATIQSCKCADTHKHTLADKTVFCKIHCVFTAHCYTTPTCQCQLMSSHIYL